MRQENTYEKRLRNCFSFRFGSLWGFSGKVKAYEVNEKLSIEANLTEVYQWLDQKKGDFKNEEKGSAVLELS